MLQTKYKYFNKKMKKLLLLFILMWSLMGQQNPYGTSSMSDMGFITAAVCTAAEDFTFDINSTEEITKEHIAEVATTKNDAKKSVSSTTSLITTITGNNGKRNNAGSTTIYGHFNENDNNNSNKLPHGVAKGDQQQPNMMYMKMSVQATSQSTSPLISVKSAEGATTATAVEAVLPTESLLMPKDQLNKTRCSKISNNSENKAKEEAKFYGTRGHKAVRKTNSNAKDNIKNGKSVLNQHEISSENKVHQRIIVDPNEINIVNSSKLTAFLSVAHAQQQLMLQFALKLKQIPRVTYFTCKNMARANSEGSNIKMQQNGKYKRHTSMNMDTVELVKRMFMPNTPSLMLKVVSIDHLVNKQNLGGMSNDEEHRSNNNWLQQILPPEPLRQIVVLNLSCGQASRRLLEMASNKAFFNSMYHWLLLEDYVFNRQTVIDEADDIESKMNSYSKGNRSSSSTQTDKSFKKEIVNDSPATNGQVKQLSAYLKDVVGVCTSGLGPDEQNNVTAINSDSTSASSIYEYKISADNGKQQRLPDDKLSSTSPNASRAGITVEDDIEIIEDFLKKLNININTELMLAKRHTRALGPPTSHPALCLLQRTPIYNMTPTTAPLPTFSFTNSTSLDFSDYKTLQKMDYYLLYDVWNPGLQYGGVLNITKIGSFSRSAGLHLDKWYRSTSTTRRRLNMQLARIRCLVVVTNQNRSDTLEEYLTSHYDTHLDSMNRFNFALLTHVKDLFNFSFILSKTSTWGYLKNGKFDGMIGALVRKQADIGGSPIFFRIERAKVIDYTTRTWVARPCFIFRHPRTTIKDRIVFLQPFSNQIWLLLLLCGCATIVFLWLLTSLEGVYKTKDCDATVEQTFIAAGLRYSLESNVKIEVKLGKCGFPRYAQTSQTVKSSRRFGLFFESTLFYISSMCQQGLPFATCFISGRCIVIISLLFSFAIYQFYSASIVGTLLMEKTKTIRTLRDLLHSSLEIGIEDIVYNRDFFLRTTDPDALELYNRKVTSVPMPADRGFGDTTANGHALPAQVAQKAKGHAYAKSVIGSNWYGPDYGVDRVKKGRFAFHVDVATAYKIIADTFTEKEICDLAEIQLFPPQKMVSIVQKGSPLRKMITYGLRRVTEVGLTDYQRKVWHSSKPRCIKQLHTDDLKVDMQTFTSALWLLIFGYAVSLLILCLEILHHKLRQPTIKR